MRKITFLRTMFFATTLFIGSIGVSAQGLIISGSSYTQNFDVIGTTATATLPTGWAVEKSTSVRTVGTFSAAATTTTYAAGNNMATNTSNGIYNFGAGDAATATDRAVGGI